MHGIITITDSRGGWRTAPTKAGAMGDEGGSRTAPTKRKTLGSLVGAFKTVSTKDINQLRGTQARTLWQRDFYDHIICNEDEFNKIREYVRTNPLQWASDPDFT